jgi:hypothetical protein
MKFLIARDSSQRTLSKERGDGPDPDRNGGADLDPSRSPKHDQIHSLIG